MLRLNMAIPPSATPSTGLLGSDLAGFPNGRRVFDDVVTIELRAWPARCDAGGPVLHPRRRGRAINEGLTSAAGDLAAMSTENYLSSFPYLGVPHSGFLVPAS